MNKKNILIAIAVAVPLILVAMAIGADVQQGHASSLGDVYRNEVVHWISHCPWAFLCFGHCGC